MILRVLFNLVEDLIRGLSGPLGYRLRKFWYRRRFADCGTGLLIEPGVHIIGTAHVQLGNNVWLDRGVVLIAGPPRIGARIVKGAHRGGRLEIGSDCHIGIGCVVQAHGGVSIGNHFTASAGAKIYSFSNDPAECRAGTTEFGCNDPGYRVTPVEIGRNVWLGLDVLVIGAHIGNDCFLRPQTIATQSIPAGMVVGGSSARQIRHRFPEA